MSTTTGGRLAYERAIRRSSLPPGARHVALTVATWANIETGVIPDRFQPSLSTIAEATGLAKSSVKRHLSVLEDEGWLGRSRPEGDKARTEHARTAYRLTIPEARPMVGLGPGWAMPEPMVGQEVGPQSAKAGPTVGQKSPSSTKSSNLSPNAAVAQDEREIDPLVQKLMSDHGATEDEATALLAQVHAEGKIGSPIGWACSTTGAFDIKQRLYALRHPSQNAPTLPGSSLPSWCKACGDGNPAAEHNQRFRTVAGDPCPACHPDALKDTAA